MVFNEWRARTVGKKKKPIFQMDKTCRYYDIELYKDTSAVVKPFRIESEPKFDWEALAGRPHARMICQCRVFEIIKLAYSCLPGGMRLADSDSELQAWNSASRIPA